MWLMPTNGSPRAMASARPKPNPTRSAPMSPGPWVAATPPMSESVSPASPSARCTMGLSCRRWARAASSGTTPPYSRCSTWEETMLARRAPSGPRMAAEVSSQDDSMARIFMGREVYHPGPNGGEPPPGRLRVAFPTPFPYRFGPSSALVVDASPGWRAERRPRAWSRHESPIVGSTGRSGLRQPGQPARRLQFLRRTPRRGGGCRPGRTGRFRPGSRLCQRPQVRPRSRIRPRRQRHALR